MHVRFETVATSSHFTSSSPIRQDERSVDRIPLSIIARTVSSGQISHKITGDEDSGPPEPPRGNIFNVRAARERHAVETAGEGARETPFPFVEGSNVIPSNLSFSVYAVSYFTRLVDTTPAYTSHRPSRESKLCVGGGFGGGFGSGGRTRVKRNHRDKGIRRH